MTITEVRSKDELEATFETHSDTPLLVQYSATWCVPCTALRKHVEALSDKVSTPIVIFYIDTAEDGLDVATNESISSVPVLRLYRGFDEVDLTGRNVMALEKELNQLLEDG